MILTKPLHVERGRQILFASEVMIDAPDARARFGADVLDRSRANAPGGEAVERRHEDAALAIMRALPSL